MEHYRQLENMSKRELYQHGNALKQRIEERIERESKVRELAEGTIFCTPACMLFLHH